MVDEGGPTSRGARNGTAGVLLRVSTKEQTLENQRIPLEKLAADRGLTIVRTFDLKGKSAYKGAHRQALEEALLAAEAGEFDHFLIWSLDRLSREGAYAVLPIVERFSKADVKLISHQEPWLEDTDSDMQPGLVAIWAQMAHSESKHKGERVRAARDRMKADAIWPGGVIAAGYGRVGGAKLSVEDSETGRYGAIEVYEPEAEIVRQIFHLYVDQRLGVRAIAKYLNENGYGRWREGTVWRILKYDYRGGPHHIHETVILPQIIDDAMWSRAQALLKANHRKKPALRSNSPLQGIINCGPACGGRWRIVPESLKRKQLGRYYCVRRHAPRPGSQETYDRCLVPSVLMAQLHEKLLRSLREAFTHPGQYVDLLTRSRGDLEARVDELEREAPDVDKLVADVEGEIKRLRHIYKRGAIEPDEFDRELDELQAKKRSLRERFPEAPERQAELDVLRGLLQGLDDMIEVTKERKAKGMRRGSFSMHPALAVTDELEDFAGSDENPLLGIDKSTDEQLAAIVKRLDIAITMHPTHAQVTGTIPLEMPLPSASDSPHASRYGRGMR